MLRRLHCDPPALISYPELTRTFENHSNVFPSVEIRDMAIAIAPATQVFSKAGKASPLKSVLGLGEVFDNTVATHLMFVNVYAHLAAE